MLHGPMSMIFFWPPMGPKDHFAFEQWVTIWAGSILASSGAGLLCALDP